MRKLTSLAVATLFAFVFGACDQAPTGSEASDLQPQTDAQTSSGATTVTDRETFTFSLLESGVEACKAGGGTEKLEGTATNHVVVHQTVAPSGQLTFFFQFETKARGVGVETGTVYEGSGTGNFSVSADTKDAMPLTFTQTFKRQLVSHGPAPDLILRITRHLTINAEGEVTSVVDRIQSECR